MSRYSLFCFRFCPQWRVRPVGVAPVLLQHFSGEGGLVGLECGRIFAFAHTKNDTKVRTLSVPALPVVAVLPHGGVGLMGCCVFPC